MKIDVSKIEGYKEMSAEDKLKALESFEMPEPDYSGYVKKDIFDKTASELADKKRELKSKMSEEEAAKLKDAEERKELEEKYKSLLHKTAVSENKARLLGLGYEENLAAETAEAMVSGNIDKILEGQKKHLDNFEKQIKAGALKSTPKPVGDSIGNGSVTKEDLKKMTPLERFEIYKSDPEHYKEVYGGN